MRQQNAQRGFQVEAAADGDVDLMQRGQAFNALLQLAVELFDFVLRVSAFGDIAKINRDSFVGWISVNLEPARQRLVVFFKMHWLSRVEDALILMIKLRRYRFGKNVPDVFAQHFAHFAAQHRRGAPVHVSEATGAIEREKAVVDAFPNIGDALVRLLQLLFVTLALGNIARYNRDFNDLAVLISNRRQRLRKVKPLAAFANAQAFDVAHAVSVFDVLQTLFGRFNDFGRHETIDRLPDHFFTRVLEQGFGAAIPCCDDAVEVAAVNRVWRRFDNRRHAVAHRLRLDTLRDIGLHADKISQDAR